MYFSSDLGDQEYEDGKADVRGLVARKTFWGQDRWVDGKSARLPLWEELVNWV